MEGYSVEQWQDYMDGRAQWAGDDQGEDEQCWLGKDGEERAQQEKWQQNAEAEETEWRQNAKVEESELQQNIEVEEGTWHQKAVTGESQWQQQAEVEEEAWPEQREEDRAWQEPEVCEEEWPEHAVEESTWPEQEASAAQRHVVCTPSWLYKYCWRHRHFCIEVQSEQHYVSVSSVLEDM